MPIHHLNTAHQGIARAGLLFGAFCWGTVWFPYRLLEQAGISGTVASVYTYSLSVLFGILLFYKQRHGQWWRQPINFYLIGLAVGWTNLSYVLAIIDGQVMRVMLLFYLSPLWTLILAKFFLHERINAQRYTVIAISLLGAGLMLWQPGDWPLPHNQAEWLGLSSGLGFAVSNVMTRHSQQLSVPAKTMAVWLGVVLVSLAFVPFLSMPFALPQQLNVHDWGLLLLVTMMLMLATLLVQYGVTHLPATQATVLFMFELVVAALASSILTDEVMSMREWLGGCLVVAATLYAALTHSV